MRKNQQKQKGFTLIELLVVISIIGLLASVVLVALNSARQKARVAKRIADLSQIAKALELYYNEYNSYPVTGARSQCATWGSYPANVVVWDTNLNQGIVASSISPGYISNFPSDPSMNASANQNCYVYVSNGTDYILLDYNLTDMTAAQIDQYSAFKNPCRNYITSKPATCMYPADNCNALSVGTPLGNATW